jgi:hypothetical protein
LQLGTFTEREAGPQGDKLSARDNVDKPLIVVVREHRTGIKTIHNQNPQEPARYKPDGGEGVHVDVALIAENRVFVDVLWMGGAIVDSLSPYVGQVLPVKLYWRASEKGGNPYVSVKPLDGPELVLAQQWAAANPTRFDAERQQRAAAAAAQPTAGVPGAPTTPPEWAMPAAAPAVGTPAPAPAQQPVAAAPGPIAGIPAEMYTAAQQYFAAQQSAAPAPAAPAPAAPTPAPAPAPVAATDPTVQALLAQIAAGGQLPPTA